MTLRDSHRDATLCVAGDFNTDFGRGQRYGSKRGRELFQEAFTNADLECMTVVSRMPESAKNPIIDHICISRRHADRARVVGSWEGTKDDGTKLSDHSGVAIEIDDLGP